MKKDHQDGGEKKRKRKKLSKKLAPSFFNLFITLFNIFIHVPLCLYLSIYLSIYLIIFRSVTVESLSIYLSSYLFTSVCSYLSKISEMPARINYRNEQIEHFNANISPTKQQKRILGEMMMMIKWMKLVNVLFLFIIFLKLFYYILFLYVRLSIFSSDGAFWGRYVGNFLNGPP